MRQHCATHVFWLQNADYRFRRFSASNWPVWWRVNAFTTQPKNRRCGGYVGVVLLVGENRCRERNCTIVPSFVDTNILLYAEDRDDETKHKRSRDLLLQLWNDQSGVISIQVLQEFYVNVRKGNKRIGERQAIEIIQEYLTWTVVENTGRLLTAAIELHQRQKLSFWDAMVVQAAIDSGCTELYTEDLNHGQRFGSVVIVNPFR